MGFILVLNKYINLIHLHIYVLHNIPGSTLEHLIIIGHKKAKLCNKTSLFHSYKNSQDMDKSLIRFYQGNCIQYTERKESERNDQNHSRGKWSRNYRKKQCNFVRFPTSTLGAIREESSYVIGPDQQKAQVKSQQKRSQFLLTMELKGGQ